MLDLIILYPNCSCLGIYVLGLLLLVHVTCSLSLPPNSSRSNCWAIVLLHSCTDNSVDCRGSDPLLPVVVLGEGFNPLVKRLARLGAELVQRSPAPYHVTQMT